MKILVIGGTGHVGRLVVDELRARSGRTSPRTPQQLTFKLPIALLLYEVRP